MVRNLCESKGGGGGLNLEGAAAILKPSCSQATGPLESPRWPETDPSKANEVRSGRRQGATKEYTLTVALRRCDLRLSENVHL